ncbi:unnamed protein product [Medioppia subpectinata]|uniref:DOMON domain-containing protein n=1 Tax=Medioppia subpectinata TaxID=1979941 RepID=A0A7R9KKW4_9ACAR|nr:unnamed protein product [Medioppia subpectinata]CAG2105348.1 unnamed protein product [Medioppia subpectinata]
MFSDGSSDHVYRECGQAYQCYGMPSKCTQRSNCTVLLRVRPPSGTGWSASVASFELNWYRNADTSTGQYVAVGLSTDDMMGDDSVTECILGSDGIAIERQGLTFGQKPKTFGVRTVHMDGISDVKTRHSNGVLTCSWTRALQTRVNNMTFDLVKNQYYVMLATGPMDNDGELKHHKHDWVSNRAYNLSSTDRSRRSSRMTSGGQTSGATNIGGSIGRTTL